MLAIYHTAWYDYGMHSGYFSLSFTLTERDRPIIKHVANDDTLGSLSADQEVSESDAADYLNVPLPFYQQILATGIIQARQDMTGRVVRFGDLQAYKLKRDAERRVGLREITRLGQDIEANK